MSAPLTPRDPLLSFRSPAGLTARLDAWIAAQGAPRPTRAEAIRRLLAEGLADVAPVAAPAPPAGYRATRIGPNGTLDEWQGEAPDDEDAAHRLGQHLKTRIDQSAPGYAPEDMVTLIRPDGEIVTVARLKELVERLSGWKIKPSGDPDLDTE